MRDLPFSGKYKGFSFMDDKSIITSFDNLYKAYKKAKTGKKKNGSCARFQMMSLEGVHSLKEQLEDQTYRMAPYNEFRVYEQYTEEMREAGRQPNGEPLGDAYQQEVRKRMRDVGIWMEFER